MRLNSARPMFFAVAVLAAVLVSPLDADQIGSISVCYACQNSGDSLVDAALAAHPDVASDGILFAIKNTSAFPITGAVLSVRGDASPPDSFALPTIGPGAEFILIPGISSDGASHPSGGLFENTGLAMDTSDGDGGVDDATIFQLTGTSNGQSVTSVTAGTSTAIPGTFTPGDPGLILTWRDVGSTGQTSFIGDGPDGDGGCTNCYYGLVAALAVGGGSTGSGLHFTTTTLPPGTAGVIYSATIGAAGGTPPYTFSVNGLPGGLSLSSSGTLSGQVNNPGTYVFSVTATDSSRASVTGNFVITMAPAPVVITTPSPLPAGMNGVEYPGQLLSAAGGFAPYVWSLTGGNLPAGMKLASDGTISGTPMASGTFNITVAVTDSAGTTANATFTLTIRTPATDLFLSAASLAFTLNAPANTLPASMTVAVQSTQASQQVSFSVTVNPTVAWLSVSHGARTPDTLVVSLTRAALSMAAGQYQTTVVVTCTSSACSGNTQNVTVTLHVVNTPPALQVLTDLLPFTATMASVQSLSQGLNIQNSGGGTLTVISATCEASWCTAGPLPSPLTGGASAAIPITVNPSSTGPGSFRTQVDIATSSGSGSVPVTLFVAANASITLAPAGVLITMQQGGAPGNPNGSFLVTTNSASPINWTATTTGFGPLAGSSTLVSGVFSGTASASSAGTATFSIDPVAAAKIPVGTYYARIEVSAPGVANSPIEFVVVLNVTPATTPVRPEPQPAGVLFLTTTGVNPQNQTVSVYSSSSTSVSFQADATSDSGWLSVSPSAGTAVVGTPGATTLAANVAALAPGVYRGSVNYAFAGAAVRSVSVTLIVSAASGSTGAGGTTRSIELPLPGGGTQANGCTASALAPAQTGLVNNFSTPAAWPTVLAILLYDNCGSAVSNGQIVATFTNGDPPLRLALADPAHALYSATWTPRISAGQVTINAQATVPGLPNVTVQLSGAVTPNAVPALTPHGTLNSFAPLVGASLAPGTIVTIYGQNLASAAAQPTTLPLPTALNGTSVIIGGVLAPLFYVGPGQVNAQVPFELQSNQQYQVVLQANGALTTPDAIQLSSTTPGIAAFADGTIIAQHADLSLVSQTSPAKSNEYLVAYLVGLGPVNPTVSDGTASPSTPLAQAVVAPVFTINGTTYPLLFAGLTPGAVGLYQMNFQVPAGLPAGNLTLAISQNGNQSNKVMMPYQP